MTYASRVSIGLTLAAGLSLYRAAAHAYVSGYSLNRLVSIHYYQAGIRSGQTKFITALLKLMSEWIRHNTKEPARFVWWRENPLDPETGLGGEHLHLLVHIDPRLQRRFRKRLLRWLRLCGATNRAGVLSVRAVPRRKEHDEIDAIVSGILGCVKYALKGLPPDACADLGIAHVAQGYISGKRSGRSLSLEDKRQAQISGVCEGAAQLLTRAADRHRRRMFVIATYMDGDRFPPARL